ncbi:MAG: DEAD/DEAH box helicase [Oligoflexia bacterium]|nr:DEAD/DEAH box helicase [Oligoflexia bacterium]
MHDNNDTNNDTIELGQDTISLDLHRYLLHFFSNREILKSIYLLKQKKVVISFYKEVPGRYFILSGLITDNKIFETRLTYKHQPPANPTTSITATTDAGDSKIILTPTSISSSCNCNNWNKEKHCIHAAVLLIKYYSNNSLTKIYTINEFGGTSIANVKKLSTYNNPTNYKTFVGFILLKIFLDPPKQLITEIKFSYCNSTNNSNNDSRDDSKDDSNNHTVYEHHNLSLIDCKYLTIEPSTTSSPNIYKLPSELQLIFSKIEKNQSKYHIDDFILISYPAITSGTLKLILCLNDEEIPLENLNKVTAPLAKIEIKKSFRPKYSDFIIYFEDSENRILPLPPALSLITNDDGLLSSFIKKDDMHDFLDELINNLNNPIYNGQSIESLPIYKSLQKSIQKDLAIDYLYSLLSFPMQFSYDYKLNLLSIFETNTLKKLISALAQNYGTIFFRFSSLSFDHKKIILRIPTNILLKNLGALYADVHHIGINVLYNKLLLKKWSPNIRFEKRSTTEDWFDFNVHLTKEDLAIIKQKNTISGNDSDFDNDLENDSDNDSDNDNDNIDAETGEMMILTPDQLELKNLLQEYLANAEKKSEDYSKKTDGKITYTLPFNKSRIFELFELYKHGFKNILSEQELELCNKLLTLKEMPVYQVPATKKATARPYQIVGYNWIRFLYENKLGGCLADDMGLGKTLQTIMFLNSIHHQISRALIICPVSIILNWKNEFEKFSDLSVEIYHGGDRNLLSASDSKSKHKIIITSYGLMKKEIDGIFSNEIFDVLVLDEVQHLKNIRSQGAIAARKIKAKFRLSLTGTPVENDLAEFYNIIELSTPGIWGPRIPNKNNSGYDARMIAKKIAKPFILRRTKLQVLTELPEKIDNIIMLNFSSHERENYLHTLVKIRESLSDIPSKKRYGEVLKSILELRKLCLWQNILSHQHSGQKELDSTKIRFLIENIQQITSEGHQSLIFSQFTSYLDIIEQQIHKLKLKFSRIDGTQTMEKRQRQVDEFQAGKSSVFLISLRAGGTGLNLTAASYIFLMDPWWNPAVESQAIDRAYRIGQKNKLTIYRLIMKNSIEEKVLDLQQAKRELFNDLMDTENNKYYSGQLTMEDFEWLLT